MATLEEIQRENKKLKAMQSNINDMQKIQNERQRLLRENKQIRSNIKFGKVKKVGAGIGKGLGRGVKRAGIGAFKGLQVMAKNIEEAERREQMRVNQLKKIKKKITKRKLVKRKKK